MIAIQRRRVCCAETIENDRYRELARRLVFVTAPKAMSTARRDQLQTWLENRRHGREGVAAGRTLQVAIEELDQLTQEKGESPEFTGIRLWLNAY
jgi:exodeoxyribonuclease-1